MKRFMIAAAAAALCLTVLYYAFYYRGFYLDFHPEAFVSAAAKTQDGEILVKNSRGEFVPFVVRGVELPSSIAGHYATDYAVEEETWLRWFALIQEMGANTVRIYTIYDDGFYNAFYEYNREREEPLYLLQGIQVSDYANNSGEDAYGAEFYASLKKDSLDVIDVVHGRKIIPFNRMKGSGSYRKDISEWVLGYILGNEWNADTIAYTNHERKEYREYQGEYFAAGTEAQAFERLLAEIMDGMVSYESRKYKVQRLMAFQNDPLKDPFVYEAEYGAQLGKYVQVDAENIRAQEGLLSGYVAAYRLYDFADGFAEYFSQEQKEELAFCMTGLDSGLYMDGYTQLLARYHSMPVIITGYGFSSSRGTDSQSGPLTEEEQGRRLAEVYQDIVNSGCSGALISTWQDVWGRRSWNTAYAQDVTNAVWWHDLQTDGQGYGLLAFDPGEEERVCLVDGDDGEWYGEEAVAGQGDTRLFARFDEECLYLLIRKEGMERDDRYYICFDVTPRSGSRTAEGLPYIFEREADFLLCLDGANNSRLLVQERYEALRENFQSQITGEDPFIHFPQKDSSEFKPINMILLNHKMVSADATLKESLEAKRHDVFETGKLRYGNGNPQSEDYDSLADFCFGKNCVEIRIPWQLLNFSDPSSMKVHDDYYVNYGVEWFGIREIYLGIAAEGTDETVEMEAFRLKGWGSAPSWHERLKKSYDMIRESWKG